ncbi:MAG: hypothetical protein WBV94_02415 [Blastocatellia bacterium]
MTALYALLQLVSNFINWTQSAEDQAKLQYIKLVNWRIWMIATPILTIILVALIIRSALKVIAKRDAQHDGEIRVLQEQKSKLAETIKELTKYQLEFEINRWVVRIEDCGGSNIPSHAISVDTALRFENSAPHPRRIKSLYISLCERNAAGVEPELKRGATTIIENQTWSMWRDDSISIPSGDVLSINLKFDLFLPPGAEIYLSRKHFLRIGMEAMNQPPCYKVLDIDLAELRKSAIVPELK